MALLSTSNPTNPLTAAVLPSLGQPPAVRAAERFAVSGNAIVTGGARGLGFESVRALLEHGANGICIFDLEVSFAGERDSLQNLHDEFPDRKILEAVLDVTEEATVEAAVARAAADLGSVDVLLCFAGNVGGTMPIMDMTLELWNKVININLTGSMLCSKYAARQMVKQNSGGSIVFVASAAGYKAVFPLYTGAYSTSKFAVRGLTTNLAAELGQHGIRVNCISPGYIMTKMTEHPVSQPGIRAYTERTPLGRVGHKSEVTGPIIMFCSAAGRYVTGLDILVDGGHHVF